jgi:predicted NUDIX family NTP pyrophosphohydrolase
MPQTSAGVLLFRRRSGGLEVLLGHPGGPFWARKDDGSWSMPKGLVEPGEDHEAAARREFEEETGFQPPATLLPLGAFRQPGGKTVIAYAAEGDLDPAALQPGSFTLEWPPRSGHTAEFPEIDRAAWFTLVEARAKILRGQAPALDALAALLAGG